MSTEHTAEELEGVERLDDLDAPGELIFGELVSMRPRLLMWRNASLTPDEDAIYIALDHIDVVIVHDTGLTIGVRDHNHYSSDDDTITRFWDQWDVV